MSAVDRLFDRARAAVSVADLAGREVKLRRAGQQLRGPCPLCGAGAKSSSGPFAVKADAWKCWSCSRRGDVTDLERELRGGTAIEAAERLVGGDFRRYEPKPRAVAPPDDDTPSRNSDLAAEMWATSRPIARTLAEHYLRQRGLSAEIIAIAAPALRYHPFAKWGWDAGARDWIKAPAMLVRPHTPAGSPPGLHATYLARDGSGKAQLTPAKRMWGPQGPAWLIGPVVNGFDGTSLVEGEGVETTLSMADLAMRRGEKVRALAALSLDRMQGGLLQDGDRCVDLFNPQGDPERPPLTWPCPSEQPWPEVRTGMDRDMSPIKLRGRTGRGRPCEFELGAEERARLCARLVLPAWRATGVKAVAEWPGPGRDFNDELRVLVGA